MQEDPLSQLKELREIVNQTSRHTQRQLQAIESNVSLVKYIIAFIISLGLALAMVQYWVPASFLLIYLWSMYGLFSRRKSFQRENILQGRKAYRRYGKRTFDYGFVWLFRNIKPMMQALSTICVVTIIILILIGVGILHTDEGFSILAIVIPIITAILFVLPSFLLDSITRSSAKGVLSNYLEEFYSSIKKSRKIKRIKVLMLVAFGLLATLYFVATLFLPAFSVYLSNFIYYPFSSESLWVLFSLALQFIIIAVLSSYFSSLSAKAEFTNTLTNLENVDAEISSLILRGDIATEDVERVKDLYLDAKQYDLRIDEYFKVVPFYFLEMRKAYLQRLQG